MRRLLCYRCGGHVKDGSEKCSSCGQQFALGLKPGPIAGFGTGSRRHRVAIEGAPYKIGDAVAGRYQIKDHLGAGPLGWLYRTLDTEADEDVALKVLSPRFLQTPEERTAFFTELAKARRIEHPNVARLYECGLDGDRPWIAMQYLEGLTLRRIMELRRQKGQGFALKEVEPIVAQIAAALDAAGDSFAHGNLKPDNVVVLPDLLKLTDFALAVCLPRAPFMAAQKAGGVHRYLAPEFLLGERLEARTDVYSLGVILGELLSGAPFDAGMDLLARNPSLPRSVNALFQRAVAVKPQDRFPSALELAAELSELLEGGDDARLGRRAGEGGMEARPPSAASVEPEEPEDDVVIEHSQTDPRVRLARALAAQEAAAVAQGGGAGATSSAGSPGGGANLPKSGLGALSPAPMAIGPAYAPAAFTPAPFTPAPPIPAGSGPGSASSHTAEEVARVAARVGATPELLTAETAVRHAPAAPTAPTASTASTAPPAPTAPTAATAPAAPTAPPAADPLPLAAGRAAPEPANPASVDADSSEGTDDAALPRGKRRGRGGRRGKKDQDSRRRRGDPEWAAAASSDSATAIGAQTPAFQALPSASAEDAVARELAGLPAGASSSGAGLLGAAAALSPPASAAALRPPSITPSFGAAVIENRGIPLQLKVVGALLVLIAALIAAIFLWSQLSGRGNPEPAEEQKGGPAGKGEAPPGSPPPSSGGAGAAQPSAQPGAHPAPAAALAVKDTGKDAAKAKAEPSDASEKAPRGDKAKLRKLSFLERLNERREARKRGQEEAIAEVTRKRDEGRNPAAPPAPPPAPAAAFRAAPAAATSSAPAAATSGAPAATTTGAPAAVIPAALAAAIAAAPARATPVAPAPQPAGAIAGLDDGESLVVSKDPSKRQRAAAELANATMAPAAIPAVAVDCPAGMRLIPGGAAQVGTEATDDLRNFGDRAAATVTLRPYCIDQFEWPNQAGKLPKMAAGYGEAEASCKRDGKRLCSEDEWEKACKGPAGLRFPYGPAFDAELCNTQDKNTQPRKPSPVGTFDKCKSGYGVYDLSGNVAEWTSSSFDTGSAERAVKGGSATRPGFDDRCSSRRRLATNAHDLMVGFRCCQESK